MKGRPIAPHACVAEAQLPRIGYTGHAATAAEPAFAHPEAVAAMTRRRSLTTSIATVAAPVNRSSAPLEAAPATPRWGSTTTWSAEFHRRRLFSPSPSPSPSHSLLRVKLRVSHKETQVGKVACLRVNLGRETQAGKRAFPLGMANKACTTSMLGSTCTASARTTERGSCTSAMTSAARRGSVLATGRAAFLFDPCEHGRDGSAHIELE